MKENSTLLQDTKVTIESKKILKLREKVTLRVKGPEN